jgi:hypothetical protein
MSVALQNELPAATDRDQSLTADRDETKYLVPPEQIAPLVTLLRSHLDAHRFTGVGSNRLPGAHHYVTTVYFDTPSSMHLRAAVASGEHNVKIRAKEYYDVHPSLAEVATNASELVRYHPWLWFELKQRVESRTLKHRFRLPKRDVPAFFREGRVTEEMLQLARADELAGAAAPLPGLNAIVAYCQTLQEPLMATSLVNYRRLSWQAADGTLRVTLDLGLSFYAPPAELWSLERALVRDSLGAARGREGYLVLEVKRTGPVPAWLEQALSAAGLSPVNYSKFVAAGRALGSCDAP